MAEAKVQGVQQGQSLGDQAEGRLRAAAVLGFLLLLHQISACKKFSLFSQRFLGTSEVFLNDILVWDKILSVLPLQLTGGRHSITPPPSPAMCVQLILPNQKDGWGFFSEFWQPDITGNFPFSATCWRPGDVWPWEMSPRRYLLPGSGNKQNLRCLPDEIPPRE